MKLVAVSMVKNEEYWIWYSLTSVYPHVDEILVFDNGSVDRTLEIVRGMDHIADKLTVFEGFGGASENANRDAILDAARECGATHVLLLDGDEVHVDENLAFCRKLLELHEHAPALSDPVENHGRPLDHTPTDGVLVKHIGFRAIHPGFAGPGTCRPHDHMEPDTNHGCYNYAIRIQSLAGLKGNGLEWGQHGYLEHGDIYVQSSPHTIWLPKLYYYHFSWHPRSSVRERGDGVYGRPAQDLGSVLAHAHVHPPAALFRGDGPGNPMLDAWGLGPMAPSSAPATSAPTTDASALT